VALRGPAMGDGEPGSTVSPQRVTALLAGCRAIDRLNAACGRVADWLVLLAVLISAANAGLRYGFARGSNAWLEAQWYLFAGMVMLGAAYTLYRNEHVRVDLIYGVLGPRGRLWVDVFGLVLFLLPGMALLAWMTWPFFLDSWLRNEGSANPGGLLRWPVKLLLPVGFALVTLQGLSELAKRLLLLAGRAPPEGLVAAYERPPQ
jgi:TRAP-type mannitol/chloroaromatic compound transport system permease small subunit